MMRADDVLLALAAIEDLPAPVWVEGGWGVDALLGRISREHHDLDLVIAAEHIDGALSKLSGLGYARDVDAAGGRIVLRGAGGRKIDLSPLIFDASGTGRSIDGEPAGGGWRCPASAFVDGAIDGQVVGCLSARVQLDRHTGYEPGDRDLHDVALLVEAFDLAVPVGYR